MAVSMLQLAITTFHIFLSAIVRLQRCAGSLNRLIIGALLGSSALGAVITRISAIALYRGAC